jgi:hypothetical protein
MNLALPRSKTLLIIAMVVCTIPQSVNADFYLNGGIATMISLNGASFGTPAEYDSFVDSANAPLYFNNATETSQLLSVGTQSFTVAGQGGAFTGLALFFTSTSTQLSGTTNFDREPDLYVYANGGPFQFGAAGIDVVTLGAFSEPGGTYAAYSGATSFTIGFETVTVSGWDGTTLSLTLTAVPEPSSLALISLIFLAASFRRSKRSEAKSRASESWST